MLQKLLTVLKKSWRHQFDCYECGPRSLGCRCGKTTKVEAPAAPDPLETARATAQAQIETNPQAARVAFDILNDPAIGLKPTTQLFENVRRDVFPGEQQVREQLQSNILANLVSPTGISDADQSAIDARREKAVSDTERSIRQRANLGGNLFGGRSAQAENEAIADLQNQFVEEDIAREERARLNALQSALPFLQILFPDVGITPPQFQSPAASGNAALNAATTARGQDINAQIAQQQADAQLKSALFSSLGFAGGSFLGR